MYLFLVVCKVTNVKGVIKNRDSNHSYYLLSIIKTVSARDITMGFRGKKSTTKRKTNLKNSRNSKAKRNVKPRQRKTYSLYKLTRRDKKENDDIPPAKKRFVPPPKPEKIDNEPSDDSESEPEDYHKKLLETFGHHSKRSKRSMAIDTSSDSSSDEVEMTENEVNHENLQELLEVATDENRVEDEEVEEGDELKENAEDTFLLHLNYELSESLRASVQSKPMVVDTFEAAWPNLANLCVTIPKCDVEKPKTKTFSIIGEQKFAPPGKIPQIYNIKSVECEDMHIKTQILENIRKANKLRTNGEQIFTPLQNEIFSVINNYQDFYYTHRTFENAEEIRFIYCVHVVNHILKTRMRVIHHNARLSNKDDVPEEFRDQGLVRPKVSWL